MKAAKESCVSKLVGSGARIPETAGGWPIIRDRGSV
jgi:hypothetical protein